MSKSKKQFAFDGITLRSGQKIGPVLSALMILTGLIVAISIFSRQTLDTSAWPTPEQLQTMLAEIEAPNMTISKELKVSNKFRSRLVSHYYYSSLSQKEIIKHYQNQFKLRGWRHQSNVAVGETISENFCKGDLLGTYSILPTGTAEKIEFVIHISISQFSITSCR